VIVLAQELERPDPDGVRERLEELGLEVGDLAVDLKQYSKSCIS